MFNKNYKSLVKGIKESELVAYWPLSENTGTNAKDVANDNLDGTYSSATLNDAQSPKGNACPSFDGINDYVDIYSSDLNTNFLGTKGTMMTWVKIPSLYDDFEGNGTEVIMNFFGHGLSEDDTIQVLNSTNTGVLANGTHTVTFVNNPNKFEVAGTNTGTGNANISTAFDTGSGKRAIRIGQGGVYQVYLGMNSDGKFRGQCEIDDVAKSINSNADFNIDWNCLVLKWGDTNNSDTVEMFCNGVSVGTASTFSKAWSTTLAQDICNIGCSNSGSNANSWEGNIAHAAIWNIELTDDEIKRLYNG